MVMSITFSLQQKHRDEQNSLCDAVKLLMQSPGYIQLFVKKKQNQKTDFFFLQPSPLGNADRFPRRLRCSSSHHGQRISREEV